MGDFKTTSYQADYLQDRLKNKEQGTNIYYKLPDQFVEYESKSYNPFYFFTSSGEFNLNEINKSYRLEQIKRMEFYKKLEQRRLAEMDRIRPPVPNLMALTLYQHVINFQNTFFGIIHDLQTEPIDMSILTKNYRSFYLGALLLIIFLLYIFVWYIRN